MIKPRKLRNLPAYIKKLRLKENGKYLLFFPKSFFVENEDAGEFTEYLSKRLLGLGIGHLIILCENTKGVKTIEANDNKTTD